MTADLDNPFLRAVLEGVRPQSATAKISADGAWIRCNHHGCHQALGTVGWGPYPAVDEVGESSALGVAGRYGFVPYRLELLNDGWVRRAGAWRADDWVRMRITQNPRNQKLIGSGGVPKIVVWAPQFIMGFSGAGQLGRVPLSVDTQSGPRLYPQGPNNPIIDPDVDQLGYQLEQFPEMSQVVECAWCRSLVTADLAAMSRELRPTDWKPGTKYFPN